jgi:polyhydroxybutyrate depolymerase
MKPLKLLSFLTLSVILATCKKETVEEPEVLGYVMGKNRFITQIAGDDREYFVHVPAGYTGASATPVVFMLHGTNGNGEDFYTNSGWKEVGEEENIITVFPSSWKYCIFDEEDGLEHPNTEKWNAQPAGWVPCEGEVLRDDILFFKTIISELKSTFNVNDKRIYLVGFSNGGSMASKCTYEMSDQFAAIVESASSLYGQAVVPLRKLPILLQRGNKDYGPGGTGPTAPMNSLPFLLTDSETTLLQGHMYNFSQTNIYNFGLDTNFTIGGNENSIVTATYVSANPDEPLNTFTVALIKDLQHAYPDGAATRNWEWLSQYTLP